jgi:hypothetical protein
MDQFFLSTRASLLLSALAALFIASGCGGSNGSGGDVEVQTGSLTKAQFVEQADQICEESRARVDKNYAALLKKTTKLLKATGSKPSPEALGVLQKEAVETILLPTYEKMIDQISSLGAPASDQDQIATFLGTEQEKLEEASEEPSDPFVHVHFFTPVTKLAEAYGMTGCAGSLG